MIGDSCRLFTILLTACALAAAADAVERSGASDGRCPCERADLCQPITTQHDREVFGFSTSTDAPYERYDWSQLTTVAWNEDPALMCAAHAAGARVVLDARAANQQAVYANRTARRAWLAAQVQRAVEEHLDGINFDLEDAVQPGDPLAGEYAALVAEAAAAFHAAIPGSQVSVDIPWSPYGVDGRWYNWSALAAAADLLFVMAYDTASQVWGRCVASANSPLALVRRGLEQWLGLGVPASKLVLGLPWYGYVYSCINPAFASGQEAELCQLPPVGFAGAPCSDAAGRQACYADLAAMRRSRSTLLQGGTSGGSGGGRSGTQRQLLGGGGLPRMVCEEERYDAVQESPYMRCRVASESRAFSHQVWFDNPASLRRKAALAAELGLRGVGMWNLDCLDHSCLEPECQRETAAMWGALSAFTGQGVAET